MDVRRVVRAAAIAATFSGGPSTVWALVAREDPLSATWAAGALVLPAERSRLLLIGAAGLMHVGLSLGWAAALTRLPRRSAATGALAGLGIAALDLGLAHAVPSRRFAAIRALPVLPQVLDHLTFGALVGAVLARHPRGLVKEWAALS